jgi:indole-3-glycerol phosphate synthase
MNHLTTILEQKRKEVSALKRRYSRLDFGSFEFAGRQTLSLSSAIRADKPAIIAEMKKASPSRGLIRREYNPVTISRQYQKGGASAVSVLTDGPFFSGSLEHMQMARQVLSVPILRKDFLLDPLQLHEAKAYGADAVLLIAAILDGHHLCDLQLEAAAIGLECIVEVHRRDELDQLDWHHTRILGINNRDLLTFQVATQITERLLPYIPDGILVVSESGFTGPDEIRRLNRAGVDAFLIGESFMRAPDPGLALQTLREGVRL